ncbi:hypothetical protein [Streptomyces sp. NPDC050804]|uniref:hypothetical protein n=1 Tax=Streptomyces sp. NPDC050804 TaxID=3154745 RepID=UPI00344AD3E6
MRFRRTIGTAILDGTLALGAATLPAQAAQAAPTAQAAVETVQIGASAAATWYYTGEIYPNRSACDSAANYIWNTQGVRGQCRGPYTKGVFELWVWL